MTLPIEHDHDGNLITSKKITFDLAGFNQDNEVATYKIYEDETKDAFDSIYVDIKEIEKIIFDREEVDKYYGTTESDDMGSIDILQNHRTGGKYKSATIDLNQ